MQLNGQSSLVTGGASGLGLAIAERFLAEGALVTVLDRNEHRLGALEERFGERVETVAGDVRSLADNRRAVAAAVARFGALHSFIGNAGIWDFNASLLDLPDDRVDAAFEEVFSINVKGYLLARKPRRRSWFDPAALSCSRSRTRRSIPAAAARSTRPRSTPRTGSCANSPSSWRRAFASTRWRPASFQRICAARVHLTRSSRRSVALSAGRSTHRKPVGRGAEDRRLHRSVRLARVRRGRVDDHGCGY